MDDALFRRSYPSDMYNPDFWEVQLDQADLEKIPNEAGLWFESGEDREQRYLWEDRVEDLAFRVVSVVSKSLTEKQREATLLYFCCKKTQREIAQIMGISRRVVSQHLFGITRNGKQVGGAVQKLRKLCRERGIAVQN